MKKSLLAIAFAMVAMVGSAQVYVGGSLDLDLAGNKTASASNFSLSPEVGYELNENLSIGAVLSFSTSSMKIKDTDYKENGFSWGIAPYARYTFLRNGIFSCFVDGGLSLVDGEDRDLSFGIYAEPGVALEVTENISIVSHLGNLGLYFVGENTNFGLNAQTTIGSVGIHYIF